MAKMLCTYHEGSLTREGLLRLEASLKQIYTAHFGERPAVIWCELPRGQGFVQGEPSDVALAMVEVADGLPQPRREAAMQALADGWAAALGVGTDKLMITLADRTLFDAYLGANRARIRPSGRLPFLLRTLGHMLWSRARNGYLSIRANA